MRTALRYIVIFVFCLLPAQALSAKDGPQISLAKKVWDFGSVRQGETKNKVFEIINTGTDDLKIENIHACCGYGVALVSSWVIKPHEKSSIEAICNATRKSLGEESKYITILSNSLNDSHLKVPVRALIVKSDAGVVVQGEQPQRPPAKESAKIPSLSSEEVYKRIEEGERIIILDVREKSEYTRKHIPNSLRLPRSEFGKDDEELKNVLRNIEKVSPVVVHCGAGIRSSYVTSKLRSWGYKAYNMEGGIAAWEKDGFPLIIGPGSPQSNEPLVINLEEAHDYYYLLFSDKTIFIDSRDAKEYKHGHIKGAINIPLGEIKEKLGSISKEKELVLYCESQDCDSALSSGRILIENGFKQGKVKVFTGGFYEWNKAGYPVG